MDGGIMKIDFPIKILVSGRGTVTPPPTKEIKKEEK